MRRPHQRPGGEQQVDALGDDQLADEGDQLLALGAGAELLDVDPGRPQARLLAQAGDVGERRPERLGRVGGADQNAIRRLHPLAGVREEARVRFDRVLQGRAVDLRREGGDAGAGEDRRAHHQVVGEGGVDPADFSGDLAHGGDVGLDVAVELGLAQLGEGFDLEALVGVAHVDGQQAADVRVVDLHPLDPHLAVLAEQVHLVAEPGQRPRQVGVVDVAAGAAQHVAVEEEDTHRSRPSY